MMRPRRKCVRVDSRSVELRAKNSDASLELTFVEHPLAFTQARLRGRTALKPTLGVKNYRCSAVIDWLDLSFHTDRPTQWMWLQRDIETAIGQKCNVRPLEGHDEYHDFLVRFQEPEYGSLLPAKKAVESRSGFRRTPSIENLEISVDFRPKVPSDEALGQMFGILVRTHLPGRDVISDPRDRPRFAWGGGDQNTRHVLRFSPKKLAGNDERLAAVEGDEDVALDATLYAGARGSRSAWRIMTKVMDKQNRRTGTRVDLSEKERRVRIEVTLNREELEEIGLVTLDDLSSFRFQTLQGRYFQFWLPTFEHFSRPGDPQAAVRNALEEERVKKFMRAGVLGLQAMDEARDRIAAGRRKEIRRILGRPLAQKPRRGKGKTSSLVAFNELSLPVKHALRRLGARIGSRP